MLEKRERRGQMSVCNFIWFDFFLNDENILDKVAEAERAGGRQRHEEVFDFVSGNAAELWIYSTVINRRHTDMIYYFPSVDLQLLSRWNEASVQSYRFVFFNWIFAHLCFCSFVS